MTDLNSLPKILAERAVPHQPECDVHVCRCTERWYAARNRAEAVIREAIDKTIEEAAQKAMNLAMSVPSRMTEDGEETVDYICRTTDVLDEIEDEYKEHADNHELTLVGFIASKVLEARDRQHEIAEAIRSLKQSNSGRAKSSEELNEPN